MNKHKVDPKSIPLKEGESWWVVHPNSGNVEFFIPNNAAAVCTSSFMVFNALSAYDIIFHDRENGWVTVVGNDTLYEMPEYIFARHFDAEAFIRSAKSLSTEEIENAKPFPYKPTLPMDIKFEDKQLKLPFIDK